MTIQIERAAEPLPNAQEAGPYLPLDRWEAVARAIIRAALDPHGLNVPESEFQAWVIALGHLYESRACHAESR